MDTEVRKKSNADLMSRRTAAIPRGIGNAHAIFAKRALNSEIWDPFRQPPPM